VAQEQAFEDEGDDTDEQRSRRGAARQQRFGRREERDAGSAPTA
jgi:hypothetical protein